MIGREAVLGVSHEQGASLFDFLENGSHTGEQFVPLPKNRPGENASSTESCSMVVDADLDPVRRVRAQASTAHDFGRQKTFARDIAFAVVVESDGYLVTLDVGSVGRKTAAEAKAVFTFHLPALPFIDGGAAFEQFNQSFKGFHKDFYVPYKHKNLICQSNRSF